MTQSPTAPMVPKLAAVERTVGHLSEMVQGSRVPDPLPIGWTGPGASPLELDLGCHKGRFLAQMAVLYPERNFLGVERQGDRVAKTHKKLRAMGLANADVIQAEAQDLVKTLGRGVVDYVHVLFPDPWPKRRHHVRRLVQKSFLEQCVQILKPGGHLRLVTDHAEYAEWMQAEVLKVPALAQGADVGREYPPTEFQLKFLADRLPIYEAVLQRRE